jgi:glutamine synthetase
MGLYEYIWLGGAYEIRSKTRVLSALDGSSMPPEWNYDGSSTGQATGTHSEIVLKPVAIYPDPLRGQDAWLVLCETYDPSGTPTETNLRAKAVRVFAAPRVAHLQPWYGFEQEYFMMDGSGKPLGLDYSKPQGPYYCSNGWGKAHGRALAEKHLAACLRAGLHVSGINAEVAPGQWEFQIGPVEGIAACDELWIARFLLERLSEEFGVSISWAPKPVQGDWNGSGCHTNFSTATMRSANGIAAIKSCVEYLEREHVNTVGLMGADNHLRLTGQQETSSMDRFSWGVGDRGASVRIGNDVWRTQCGYFEDRRPAANMDPYVVAPIHALAAAATSGSLALS